MLALFFLGTRIIVPTTLHTLLVYGQLSTGHAGLNQRVELNVTENVYLSNEKVMMGIIFKMQSCTMLIIFAADYFKFM